MDTCRMEITMLDPQTYASLQSHKLRQDILVRLFQDGYENALSKQALANMLGIKYQQLIYQLNDHLSEFWDVKGDEKVRGARREFIGPRNRHAVYIALGKDGRIFVIDPLAGLFGPLSEVGLRCDTCHPEEAEHCLKTLREKDIIPRVLETAEESTLYKNGREVPFRPLDQGIIETLRGLAKGENCALVIPCERCTFLQRKNIITVE
ncbi:MAG: hypothetical protein AB7E27_00350 [Candidatus Methanomethylophilaceae archaeon]